MYLQGGGKRGLACWHRRAGKDDVALHWAAVSANDVGYEGCLGRVGNYWHMLPEAAQARKAIWESINAHTGKRRIDEAFPMELRSATLETPMMIKFKSGSTWQVVGSDNYNSLVGAAPIGVVFSEWALADPTAWAYIQPILLENNGWAMFLYTSRGRNHGHTLYRSAQKDPSWFAERLTVDETGIMSQAALDEALRNYQDLYGMEAGEAFFQQEFHCSFEAAVLGAYYGAQMNKLEQQGRLTRVDYDPSLPVNVVYDLGINDDTSIWFYQVAFGEIRLIDFYFNHGQDIDHYIDVLKERKSRPIDGYPEGKLYGQVLTADAELEREASPGYGTHWMPWDALPKTMASRGKSIQEQYWKNGEGYKAQLVKNVSVESGILAARQTLKRCWFDDERCAHGIEALRQYKRSWDEKHKIFSDQPVHDWTSHPADAFRYLSWVWSVPSAKVVKEDKHALMAHPRIAGRTVSTQTINEIIRGLERKRRQREGR